MTTTTRRALCALATAAAALLFAASAGAMILVQVPNLKGSSSVPGYEGWFVADSFSFGVEREMTESGAKGGTSNINIGVGELQECTISKSLDNTSAALAQFAINGNSPGLVQIAFLTVIDGRPREYLRYKLENAFVKNWSTSADADDRPTEDVAFYFNKIAFQYTDAGKGGTSSMGWDLVKNAPLRF